MLQDLDIATLFPDNLSSLLTSDQPKVIAQN
jgi:hypothetical protein